MIRLLLALVIVALSVLFVLRNLEQAPIQEHADGSLDGPAGAIREAEQVKALLETQQQTLQERAERHRE